MGMLVFLFFYLAGFFAQASLDISNWSSEARGFVATFGMMAFLIVSIGSFVAQIEAESK